MKSNFFWRFGIRLILVGIGLVIAFFAAAFESLQVAGRYTDLYALESETLKDGKHYGGVITWIYSNYAEEGYQTEYSDEIVNAYEQYYITDVYVASLDKWMYISISLRDDEMIRQADRMYASDYEEGDPDFMFEMSGICEPLDPELKGYIIESAGINSDEFNEMFLPYNIRQVDAEGNGTILVIGVVVIVIFGVVIMVLVKKAKQKKLEGDGTVHMDLPPEIAEAVRRNNSQSATADGFTLAPDDLPDMSNIKQPDTDSFFADLDRKRGSPRGQVAGETVVPAATFTSAPAAKASPYAGVNENAEMDELILPESGEIPPETEPEFTHPGGGGTDTPAPTSSVGEISAEEYLNKDFISQ
jgi:hypothetical protein